MNGGQDFIIVNKLSKRFGLKKALDAVSFAISTGRITAFLGPNGAGKTTAIKCILGLIRKDSGNIDVCGKKVRNLQNFKFMVRIGVILESHAFYSHLRARDNLELLARFDRCNPDEKKIDRLLDTVGLKNAGEDKVKTFSSGMRQKLALASALLNGPELLVLDEPFTGLDPNAMDYLSGILRTFVNEGGTAFISSHLLAEVENLCNDIVIINQGKIVRAGNMESLTEGKTLKSVYLEATGGRHD